METQTLKNRTLVSTNTVAHDNGNSTSTTGNTLSGGEFKTFSRGKVRRSGWDVKMTDISETGVRKRKSRWSDDEPKQILHLPDLPRRIVSDLQGQILNSKLVDISRKLQSDSPLDDRLEGVRSPSPEPIYDNSGIRVNTREYRARKRLNCERRDIIDEIVKKHPGFKPPADYLHTVDCVSDKTLLYIGFLPPTLGDDGLISHFSPYGEIVMAAVVKERRNNINNKVYDFVKYATVEQEYAAILAMNGLSIDGRNILVKAVGGPQQLAVGGALDAPVPCWGPIPRCSGYLPAQSPQLTYIFSSYGSLHYYVANPAEEVPQTLGSVRWVSNPPPPPTELPESLSNVPCAGRITQGADSRKASNSVYRSQLLPIFVLGVSLIMTYFHFGQ